MLDGPADQVAFHLFNRLERQRGRGVFGVGVFSERIGRGRYRRKKKVVGENQRRGAEKDCPFDHVFQLPHVSGPSVTAQQFDRPVRKSGKPLFHLLGEKSQEMPGQEENVVPPLAQRGDRYFKYVEPEEKVAPEPARLNFLFQIAVRRGDDPYIDLNRPVPADPLERLSFEYPEEFRLESRLHFGNLVEEEGPLVRRLELADFSFDRAGKRSLFMTEQLALQKGFRQCRAVQADERLVAPCAAEMDRARDEFLADPALAPDQRGRFAFGDPADDLQHVENPGRFSDDRRVLRQKTAERTVFVPLA